MHDPNECIIELLGIIGYHGSPDDLRILGYMDDYRIRNAVRRKLMILHKNTDHGKVGLFIKKYY